MSKVTNQEIKIHYRGEEITIPKGTSTTHKTALGIDETYNFINDFSWYKPHLKGVARQMATHDMRHYGINIPSSKVEFI